MLSIHFHKSKLNETELNVGNKDLRMQLVTILINSDHNHAHSYLVNMNDYCTSLDIIPDLYHFMSFM